MSNKKKMGLLVMAYGTPYKKEDIVPYYTAIRHGRRPSQEQIEDLTRRYEAIGGVSPLARLTKAQMDALTERLNHGQDDIIFQSRLGLKYIHPFIEDAVEDMRQDGIEQAIALSLAPHYSRFSVQAYTDRAKKAAGDQGPAIYPIKSWYTEPKFIQYWSQAIRGILDALPEDERSTSVVIFSAHSLPRRILTGGDPYPDQIAETIQAITAQTDIPHVAQAWQSAGKTPDPWLGPDIMDKIRELMTGHHYKHLIFCPIGFVSEHLEVLYDNDMECRTLVESLGGAYHRPSMPDTDPLFIEALASAVWKACQKNKGVLS
ncbi:ferrochelatase [Sporolactobacillus sp. Y61]|uniref:Coproporphyrin III ferrochelatase n=1 Tax=Sporolactobacillus sp. Y61 TaxID=3160863 RepID=A0AAU8IBG2_9BACL|nr:ferrochelatase [Sporolactobacillus sp. THM19-2]RYL86512.1 ferrochelatase [Sporolactobacillus sp. THM19-2]